MTKGESILKRNARSAFDLTASSFERQRSLPRETVEAVRPAIWSGAQLPQRAWVLDLGAGTGRMAKSFLAAGDIYFGVDSSLAMLQEFSAKPELRKSDSHFLAQADGRQLPFRNCVFDVILLMQV